MTALTQAQAPAAAQSTAPVVAAKDLRQVYKISRGFLREPGRLQAVGGVSFQVMPGRTLAVVGESGCGKSTLARMVALIETPTAGELRLTGVDVVGASISDTMRASVDLPQPDSPTTASVLPARSVNDTPPTACK